jgi:hypothetical protein
MEYGWASLGWWKLLFEFYYLIQKVDECLHELNDLKTRLTLPNVFSALRVSFL